MPSPPLAALLCLFAFLAGFVDAVVGGGGLIQLPAMLVMMPGTAVPTLMGTNKLASIFGTGSAAVAYARRVTLDRPVLATAALAAALCSFAGARVAAHVPTAYFRPAVAAVLVLVAIYTIRRPQLGAAAVAAAVPRRLALLAAAAIGGAVGFYDGVFGPGAGSFLVFLFVGVLGMDFLRASASAKAVNVATNVAALAYFIPTGHVIYALAIPMAACNAVGGVLGARLAIRRGSGFVRGLFLVVVGALIARLLWDVARAAAAA